MDFPEEENDSLAFQQDSQESQPEYEIATNYCKNNADLYENYQDKKSKMLLCRKSGKLNKEEKKELKRKRKLMKKRAKLNEKMNLKMIIKGEHHTEETEENPETFFSNNMGGIKQEMNSTSLNPTDDTLVDGEIYDNSECLPKCKKRKHNRSHAEERNYVEEKTENATEENEESSNDECTHKTENIGVFDSDDDEEYDEENSGALKNFFHHITMSMKAKHDEVDKYFLVLASTIKKCDLTPLELTQLQCNLLAYLKGELIKMGKM